MSRSRDKTTDNDCRSRSRSRDRDQETYDELVALQGPKPKSNSNKMRARQFADIAAAVQREHRLRQSQMKSKKGNIAYTSSSNKSSTNDKRQLNPSSSKPNGFPQSSSKILRETSTNPQSAKRPKSKHSNSNNFS